MSVDLERVKSLGVNPIPGESAAGANIQGEDDYDRVERAFSELTALDRGATGGVKPVGGGVAPTWAKLTDDCVRILGERSKHLRVATFLAIALFREEGLEGLSAGLQMIDGLLGAFWETMYPPNAPKLLKARVSSLDFLSTYIAGETEKSGGLLAVRGQKTLDEWRGSVSAGLSLTERGQAVERLKGMLGWIEASQKAVDSLIERSGSLFPPDLSPSLTSLRAALDNLQSAFNEEVEQNKPPEPGAGKAPETGAGARPAAAGPSAPSVSFSPAGSAANAQEIYKFLRSAAPVLRQLNAADPAAYRLARIAVWGGITNLPAARDGGVTMINPDAVTEGAARNFANLEQTGNWLTLLNQAEGMFGGTAPLWLDLQYYVHRSLKGLGPAFDQAAKAVADELSLFLTRLPGLEALKFAKGTPFAGDITRQWIQTGVLAVTGKAPVAAPSLTGESGAGASSELEDALSRARSLLEENKSAEAMNLIQEKANGAKSLREKFRWRAALARIAQEARKPRLALPILEALMADIDRFNLETWEPALCLPVMHELYNLFNAAQGRKNEAEQVLGRLCRLNIGAALSLGE